jgi:hypothetical protein
MIRSGPSTSVCLSCLKYLCTFLLPEFGMLACSEYIVRGTEDRHARGMASIMISIYDITLSV